MFQLVRERDETVLCRAILVGLDVALSVRRAARRNGRPLEIRLVAVLRNTSREKVLLREHPVVNLDAGKDDDNNYTYALS